MPLISVQEILNAVYDTSTNKLNTSQTANVEVANTDAADFRTSAVQDGAAALNVSAKSNDGALLRTSAVQDGAAALNVSAKSDSAALFRVSSFEGGYTYNNIITSAQTQVKGSAGILGLVALNSTLVSAIRGYDNTVSGGSILFTIPASTAPISIRYDVRFATGLVVSSGAAADNITIMYN